MSVLPSFGSLGLTSLVYLSLTLGIGALVVGVLWCRRSLLVIVCGLVTELSHVGAVSLAVLLGWAVIHETIGLWCLVREQVRLSDLGFQMLARSKVAALAMLSPPRALPWVVSFVGWWGLWLNMCVLLGLVVALVGLVRIRRGIV